MGDYNIGLRMKYEQQCPDCGQSDFVEDHASGDLVCRVGGRTCAVGWWVLLGGVGGWGAKGRAPLAARKLAFLALAGLQVASLPATDDGWLPQGANAPPRRRGCPRRVAFPACPLPPAAPQNCGVVVEAHVIDERSEWRTFADKVRRGGGWQQRNC